MEDKKAVREMRVKIDKEFEKKQSALFAKWNVSFAFGKVQTDEYIRQQRAKGYEGEFIPLNFICPGMIGRAEGVKDFIDELVALHKEMKAAKRNAWTKDAYIEHQLWNYECFYCRDSWEEMQKAVRDYFPDATDEDFERVWNEVNERAA